MLYNNYGKKTGLLGSIFILFMTSPAPYILVLTVLLQKITGINFYVSLIIGTLFSIIYVWQGGFRAVVQTDKLQFLFMFTGFIVLFYVLNDQHFPVTELFAKLDSTHLSLSGGLSWQEIIVWFFIASWTFVDPGFHQRCAAAKDPGTAKKGILLSIIFWFFFDLLTISSGLYAFVLLPGVDPLMSYPELANSVLPPFAKGLFFTGLFAIIMSTIDSYTFLSALTFGRDIVYRIKKDDDKRITVLVRFGLIVTAIFAIIMIIIIPSVIDLWYNLGTLFVPPLLLPLIAAYFPKIRLSAKQIFFIMIVSFIISFSLFLFEQINTVLGYPQYILGVEPFFPGLLFSVIGYLLLNVYSYFKLLFQLRITDMEERRPKTGKN